MRTLNRPAVKAMDYVDIGPSYRLKRPDLMLAVWAASRVPRLPAIDAPRSSLPPSAKSFNGFKRAWRSALRRSWLRSIY